MRIEFNLPSLLWFSSGGRVTNAPLIIQEGGEPKMSFEVICTIGPANLNRETLTKIDAIGPCIYRLNGAHVGPDDVKQNVDEIRGYIPGARIMVDLPGNKVRTSGLSEPIQLKSGKKFKLEKNQVNLETFYEYVKPGDTILANDSVYTLEVVGVEGETIEILSHSDGPLLTNKGMHVHGIHADIPFLFQKDQDLIKASGEAGVDIISLSFVRDAADVQIAIDLAGEFDYKPEIFAKIETLSATKNLKGILELVNVCNIDRGDLSTDVPLVELPLYQEEVIETVLAAGKKIFLATQFLKNMEVNPVPLISEVMDMHKSLRQGISGIQLSEETAVGKYPAECVQFSFDTYNLVKSRELVPA